MRYILAALTALLSVPVSAQDLQYFDTATENCIADTPEGDDISACAGTSAEMCMAATSDGYTTVGMGFCLRSELDFWDARLNTTYQRALASSKRTDVALEEVGSSLPRQEDALRKMQRAWIPFRDAACEYEYSNWGGGTGGGPAHTSCMMHLTAQQTARLGAWLDD